MARDTTATKKTQACSPFCCCIGEKVKGLGPCQGPRPWSRSRPLTLPRLEPRGHGYVGSGQPSRSRPRPCQRLKLTRDKPATLTSRCYCILRKRRKETGRKGHEDDIVTIEHNNKKMLCNRSRLWHLRQHPLSCPCSKVSRGDGRLGHFPCDRIASLSRQTRMGRVNTSAPVAVLGLPSRARSRVSLRGRKRRVCVSVKACAPRPPPTFREMK